VNVNTLGALIGAVAGLAFVVLSLLAFRARRADRKAGNLAAVRETNVAAMRWVYDVRMWAAARGLDLPPLPKELTPDYLAGRAEGENNPELAGLADLASRMLPGPGGGGIPPVSES
jgi:hypothetical protein